MLTLLLALTLALSGCGPKQPADETTAPAEETQETQAGTAEETQEEEVSGSSLELPGGASLSVGDAYGDDFEGFRQLLAERSNVNYRFYPELNHCFVPGIYNDILKASEEYSVEQHIGAEVLDDIAGFILNN